MSDANRYAKAGIKAIKNGEREKGRQFLEKAISLDEKNEYAWLWLTAVVSSAEEKHICLDNVLAINPTNKSARKGLAKLGFDVPEPAQASQEASEIGPVTDERPYWMQPAEEINTNQEPEDRFNDAWASRSSLCAFCAGIITKQDKYCPQCKRKVVGLETYNPNMSRSLTIWLSLRSANHLFNITLFLYLIPTIFGNRTVYFQNIPIVEPSDELRLATYRWLASLILAMLFTGALYLRHRWAYWLSILFTVLSFLGLIFVFFFSSFIPSTDAIGAIIWMCITLPIVAWILGIIYLVFTSSGDFVKIPRRRVATTNPKVKHHWQLNKLALAYSKQKMWATAVLYWQQASGQAPGNITYLMSLAKAYAKLNFFERSLDSYQTALEKSREPRIKREIQQKISDVEKRLLALK